VFTVHYSLFTVHFSTKDWVMKLLLDTDIGSDIDDAVCLAYLLAQPECELLGITTVSGEPEKRAMLASALCKAAGKEPPILPGAARPAAGGSAPDQRTAECGAGTLAARNALLRWARDWLHA
jgi:inosine-uridine nucleoside N-ribohydrolase